MSTSSRSSEEDSNQLAYFFKHTQPAPHPARLQKKKSGAKITTFFSVVRRKESLSKDEIVTSSPIAGRKSSVVSHSPQNNVVPPCPELPPMLKPVVREEITSSGAKHLYIDISAYESEESEKDGFYHASSMPRVPPPPHLDEIRKTTPLESFFFTEEMFSPLASSPVEKAILGDIHTRDDDDGFGSPPRTPPIIVRDFAHDSSIAGSTSVSLYGSPRSPKPVPTTPPRVCVPVGQSPLAASREEEVRMRKLRDRERKKEREAERHRLNAMRLLEFGIEGDGNGDVVEGGGVTAGFEIEVGIEGGMNGFGLSPVIELESKASDEMDDVAGEGEADMVWVEKEEWERMKSLNRELSTELASVVGIDRWNGARLEAGEVLDLCRKIRRNGLFVR